jgi:hypothetical protein
MRETVPLQILDPFIVLFDVSHTPSRHGSNARIAVGSTGGRPARAGNRGQDDPATAEGTAVLPGYLMLGEKISAQEITGALVIGSAVQS